MGSDFPSAFCYRLVVPDVLLWLDVVGFVEDGEVVLCVVPDTAQPPFVCEYSAAASEPPGGGSGVCHRYTGFHYQYCPELLCADHQPVFGALRYG